MSAKINEQYFAIRVGNPRKHRCYLWVGPDGNVPRLFINRDDAQEYVNTGWDREVPAKVVRVKLKA
jgi:hypothetical protein